MGNKDTRNINEALNSFFRLITPDMYNKQKTFLRNCNSKEADGILEIMDGIRDLYLSYSGEDLANNMPAISDYSQFLRYVKDAREKGLDCRGFCYYMGNETAPLTEGEHIYAVSYGSLRVILADTTDGIAVLKPVLARKMGRYYPLTDQEVEAAGISESEFIIPRKVDPTVFHVIVLSKKKAGGGQAV